MSPSSRHLARILGNCLLVVNVLPVRVGVGVSAHDVLLGSVRSGSCCLDSCSVRSVLGESRSSKVVLRYGILSSLADRHDDGFARVLLCLVVVCIEEVRGPNNGFLEVLCVRML